jgi:hypothetical protein
MRKGVSSQDDCTNYFKKQRTLKPHDHMTAAHAKSAARKSQRLVPDLTAANKAIRILLGGVVLGGSDVHAKSVSIL